MFGSVFVLLGLLDTIHRRSDWKGLMLRYEQSGFESLRAYANYVYIGGTLLIPASGAVAGAIAGVLGGVVSGAIGDTVGPVRRVGA